MDLCLKELLQMIKVESEKDPNFRDGSGKKMNKVAGLIQESLGIQDSSSKIMNFVVDDLLDFS